jgi:hypothetical protein
LPPPPPQPSAPILLRPNPHRPDPPALCSGDNIVAIDLIAEHIRTKLQQHYLRRIYPNLEVIPSNYQIRGMHTIIRDAATSKSDFVFYANRLNRLVRGTAARVWASAKRPSAHTPSAQDCASHPKLSSCLAAAWAVWAQLLRRGSG